MSIRPVDRSMTQATPLDGGVAEAIPKTISPEASALLEECVLATQEIHDTFTIMDGNFSDENIKGLELSYLCRKIDLENLKLVNAEVQRDYIDQLNAQEIEQTLQAIYTVRCDEEYARIVAGLEELREEADLGAIGTEGDDLLRLGELRYPVIQESDFYIKQLPWDLQSILARRIPLFALPKLNKNPPITWHLNTASCIIPGASLFPHFSSSDLAHIVTVKKSWFSNVERKTLMQWQILKFRNELRDDLIRLQDLKRHSIQHDQLSAIHPSVRLLNSYVPSNENIPSCMQKITSRAFKQALVNFIIEGNHPLELAKNMGANFIHRRLIQELCCNPERSLLARNTIAETFEVSCDRSRAIGHLLKIYNASQRPELAYHVLDELYPNGTPSIDHDLSTEYALTTWDCTGWLLSKINDPALRCDRMMGYALNLFHNQHWREAIDCFISHLDLGIENGKLNEVINHLNASLKTIEQFMWIAYRLEGSHVPVRYKWLVLKKVILPNLCHLEQPHEAARVVSQFSEKVAKMDGIPEDERQSMMDDMEQQLLQLRGLAPNP